MSPLKLHLANVLIKAVVKAGEPSYTSGAQKEGTAATLNNIPIVKSTIPMVNQIGNSAERDKSLISTTSKLPIAVNQTYSK
jgi:hypothetical protein